MTDQTSVKILSYPGHPRGVQLRAPGLGCGYLKTFYLSSVQNWRNLLDEKFKYLQPSPAALNSTLLGRHAEWCPTLAVTLDQHAAPGLNWRAGTGWHDAIAGSAPLLPSTSTGDRAVGPLRPWGPAIFIIFIYIDKIYTVSMLISHFLNLANVFDTVSQC